MAFALTLLAALTACETAMECGAGTILRNGLCELEQPPTARCGPGTHLDSSSGECVADHDWAECGDLATGELDAEGVLHCSCSQLASRERGQ